MRILAFTNTKHIFIFTSVFVCMKTHNTAYSYTAMDNKHDGVTCGSSCMSISFQKWHKHVNLLPIMDINKLQSCSEEQLSSITVDFCLGSQ